MKFLRKIKMFWLSFLLGGFVAPGLALGQTPEVGRSAAARYFEGQQTQRAPNSTSPADRVMKLHVGLFTESEAWLWGQRHKETHVAKETYGVTYRVGEWVGAMDLSLRIDFARFIIPNEDIQPQKMSVISLLTFPDAASRFPLYFGLGAGPGIFFRQIEGESQISLDYQLVAGARFMEIAGSFGFFVEGGMKNHFHLLSDGQLNAVHLTLGAVFNF